MRGVVIADDELVLPPQHIDRLRIVVYKGSDLGITLPHLHGTSLSGVRLPLKVGGVLLLRVKGELQHIRLRDPVEEGGLRHQSEGLLMTVVSGIVPDESRINGERRGELLLDPQVYIRQ